LTTNDRLGEMVEAFNTSVVDTVVPPQSLKFENNTLEMDLENDDE
jgi:hypothetical protein